MLATYLVNATRKDLNAQCVMPDCTLILRKGRLLPLKSIRYINAFQTICKLLSPRPATQLRLFCGMKLEFKANASICWYLLPHLNLKLRGAYSSVSWDISKRSNSRLKLVRDTTTTLILLHVNPKSNMWSAKHSPCSEWVFVYLSWFLYKYLKSEV